MTLELPLDLLTNPDVMAAVAAAVDYLTGLPEDEVTDETIDALAEALDELVRLDALLPPPVGPIAEMLDRPVFRALLLLGVSLRRQQGRDPEVEPKKGKPLRLKRWFRRKVEAGQP